MRKKMFRYIRSKLYTMLDFLNDGDYKCARLVYKDVRSAVDSWVLLDLIDLNYYRRIDRYFYDILKSCSSIPFPDVYLKNIAFRSELRSHRIFLGF